MLKLDDQFYDCSFAESYCQSWMDRNVCYRYREDDHVGEVCRAAATPPLPVCGLQQVSGQWGAAPLPQQCGLQNCPLTGLPRGWEEVRNFPSDVLRDIPILNIYTDCGQKKSCGNISLSSNYLNIKALMSYIANVVHYLLYTYLEGQDSSAVDGKLCFSVQLLQLWRRILGQLGSNSQHPRH